jgi:hypothetical protein
MTVSLKIHRQLVLNAVLMAVPRRRGLPTQVERARTMKRLELRVCVLAGIA